MFERFTDRARRVVVLAQAEAGKLNHNYIGTEHLLLGMMNEGDGIAAQALTSLGVRLDAVRDRVKEIVGPGQDDHAQSGNIPFTRRAKKVLELSLRESLQLGHDYIGTEHILLGIVREGHGVAAQVLADLGADLNRVRQAVVQLVATQEPEDPAVLRRRRSHAPPDEIITRLEMIAARLAVIEQRLGIQPPAASAPPPEQPETPEQPGESGGAAEGGEAGGAATA
jgi:ATP-dependent Clp protease ATP-binding subunit ClpC